MQLCRITKGGYYKELYLKGDKALLEQDGLVVDAKDELVFIDRLIVSDVRVPLVYLSAKKLIINELRFEGYWGDGANIRASHLHVQKWHGLNPVKRFDYSQYHQDVIFQAYAVKDDGYTLDAQSTIEDIVIDELLIRSTVPEANGIMLSELNQYRNFSIGTKGLDIAIQSKYWLNGNNLSNSVLGGSSVKMAGKPVPGIYLFDRPKNKSTSNYKTEDLLLVNLPVDAPYDIIGEYKTY